MKHARAVCAFALALAMVLVFLPRGASAGSASMAAFAPSPTPVWRAGGALPQLSFARLLRKTKTEKGLSYDSLIIQSIVEKPAAPARGGPRRASQTSEIRPAAHAIQCLAAHPHQGPPA